MEKIKQEAEKVAEKVREFAAAHPRATVTGAAVTGGAVAGMVVTSKVGLAVLTVAGVVVAVGVGVGVGRVLGEALIRRPVEYMPPAAPGSPTA